MEPRPSSRALEKQASRDADRQAIASGRLSLAEVTRANTLVRGHGTRLMTELRQPGCLW